MDFLFICNSVLLGVGLAMDAFSVSVANGLNEPNMPRPRMTWVAGVYAGFQFLMPMIGWFCVRTAASKFKAFEHWIPLIALILLLYIGGTMLLEGIQLWKEKRASSCPDSSKGAESGDSLSTGKLMLQGIATSIDALSVGFTISEYGLHMATICCLIIAVVTFGICMGGLLSGKRFGTRLEEKAPILGGLILIGIGVEIFVKGWFGL